MSKAIGINHVALVVKNLEEACEFYEKELGLEVIPAFLFDYPTAFFKINETQQLHLTEWDDVYSFRGHVCMQVDDINAVFWRMKALGVIDINPWGKVRQLPFDLSRCLLETLQEISLNCPVNQVLKLILPFLTMNCIKRVFMFPVETISVGINHKMQHYIITNKES